jgi:uncharacterized protein (UPF0548 family)
MFGMPWVNLHWQSAPIVVGTDIAVSLHHFGFYSLNACRIVYLVDEEGAVKRFGFAYGTLAEHAESGEERFTVSVRRTHVDGRRETSLEIVRPVSASGSKLWG